VALTPRRVALRGAVALALLAGCLPGCGGSGARGDRAERRRKRKERREARAEAGRSPAEPPAPGAAEAHAAAGAALQRGHLDAAMEGWTAACAAGHPDACRMEVRWSRRRALGLPLPSPTSSP